MSDQVAVRSLAVGAPEAGVKAYGVAGIEPLEFPDVAGPVLALGQRPEVGIVVQWPCPEGVAAVGRPLAGIGGDGGQ